MISTRSNSSTALSETTDRPLFESYFEDMLRRVSHEYMRETFGWRRPYDAQRQKRTLPYSDDDSLAAVRRVGREMATKPTILSATSKMTSYVIGRGHTYTIAARSPNLTNKTQAKAQERVGAEIRLALDLALEELNWNSHQEECYQRLLRDGEVFRRIWLLKDRVDITYIEPEDIAQPSSSRQIRMETVPQYVRDLWQDQDTPPGQLGIISAPRDAREVWGYWQRDEDERGQEVFTFINSLSVQHLKDGVDSNDPRGIPRFYHAFCHVIGIDEVDTAMRTLFLVQSKHAAVYNYEQSSLISDMKRIARLGEKIDAESDNGRVSAPGVAHAKGFTIELPGVQVASRDAVEIIQQEQRLIGGCSDIPEHLISEDANTGNRSSLVAAEGPFERRVQREQLRVFNHDLDLLKRIVKKALNWRVAEEKDKWTRFKITPHFPVAHARDRDKQVESEALMMNSRIKSRRQVQEALGIDSDQAYQEIIGDPIELPELNPETGNSEGKPKPKAKSSSSSKSTS